jgi:hypothetical protein
MGRKGGGSRGVDGLEVGVAVVVRVLERARR